MDGMIDGYLEKGEYYNAQMMYKTLAFRHKKRGAYGEAVALLCVGAERLLRAQQYLAGSELGQLMVQMYMEAKYPETDELVGKVVALSEMFPCEQYEQQKIFLLTAIKWSASTRTVAREGLASLKAAVPYPGHPLLFRTLGMREVQLGWLLAAEDHFIKGAAADLLETHMKSLLPQMEENEIDLFVTRSILKFLCLGDLKNANLLMNGFKEILFEKREPSPLSNFTRFLLLVLEHQAYPLFAKLLETYQPSIQRDPSFLPMLHSIGELFYGVKTRSGGLSDLLASFLGGGSQS